MADITRRDFIRGLSIAWLGAAVTQDGLSQNASLPDEQISLALIGAGAQGRNLMMLCTKLLGVRFAAVCDIWPYHQKYASAILDHLGQPVSVYEDYRDLLAKENNLTAAIVATPDCAHADQVIACLKAGLHVYCEKAMGHPLEQAAVIIKTAKETGRLVQGNAGQSPIMIMITMGKCGTVTNYDYDNHNW